MCLTGKLVARVPVFVTGAWTTYLGGCYPDIYFTVLQDWLARGRVFLLIKQKFVVTYRIRQTDISAFLDGCFKTHLLSKTFIHRKRWLFLYFRKNMTFLTVGVLRTCKALSVAFKTVYRWVMTDCFFMSHLLVSQKLTSVIKTAEEKKSWTVSVLKISLI